jgi:hypothetical protein
MKTYEATHKNTRKIKRVLKLKRYSMDEFFAACPFTLEQLRTHDRTHELLCWRQLGMTWQLLSGENLTNTGRFFGRTHATVINSLNCVLNTVDGFGSPVMADAIKRIMERSATPGIRIDSHEISDFLTRHIGDPDEVDELTRRIFEIVNE